MTEEEQKILQKKRDKDDARLYEKPKYMVGDIIVYPDRYTSNDDSMTTLLQSQIIDATAYIETSDPKDKLSWFYTTRETEREDSDTLGDDDILYKLNEEWYED